MQLLYNSDNFSVVRFELGDAGDAVEAGALGQAGDVSAGATPGALALSTAAAVSADGSPVSGPRLHRGGYEIVDKFSRKEIYLDGAMAETFQQGVQALVEQGPSEEALDDYIGRFTTSAQHPVVMH